MNTSAVVRHRLRPQLIEVYDHPDAPAQLYTRLMLGIIPPAEDGSEEGYACVVGEVYDDDPRQKQRQIILIDEAVALDPDDFAPQVVSSHWDRFYREVTRDGVTRDLAHKEGPTLSDLQQAAIALKDIYHPAPAEAMRITFPGWILPHKPADATPNAADPFVASIRSTWGLQYYPDHAYSDHDYEEWFPTFRSSMLRASIGASPPQGANPAANRELVETLLARDDLLHNPHCTHFLNSAKSLPHTLVGALCAVFRAQDWAYYMREKADDYDGYHTIEELEQQRRDERQSVKQARAKNLRTAQWMTGINVRR